MFQRMRMDRHVPLLRQGPQCPDMVDMPMRQHDRRRRPIGAEPGLGRAGDHAGSAGQAGINQYPVAAGAADEHDIDHCQPAIGDVRGQRPDRFVRHVEAI